MDDSRTCSACGSQIGPAHAFCGECGSFAISSVELANLATDSRQKEPSADPRPISAADVPTCGICDAGIYRDGKCTSCGVSAPGRNMPASPKTIATAPSVSVACPLCSASLAPDASACGLCGATIASSEGSADPGHIAVSSLPTVLRLPSCEGCATPVSPRSAFCHVCGMATALPAV